MALPARRRIGNDAAQRPVGWMTIMNSCILAEQLFDFIP